jgi:hypothetical protein
MFSPKTQRVLTSTPLIVLTVIVAVGGAWLVNLFKKNRGEK